MNFWETIGVLATAAAVGLYCFQPPDRANAGSSIHWVFCDPTLWAALRRGPRDTATVALVLAGITIWGTLTGGGPFTTADLNVSFLLVLMFLISITVPSLLLSADVEVRKKADKSAPRADRTRTEGRRAYARAGARQCGKIALSRHGKP